MTLAYCYNNAQPLRFQSFFFSAVKVKPPSYFRRCREQFATTAYIQDCLIYVLQQSSMFEAGRDRCS